MMNWESGVTKVAKAHEENAALRARVYKLEEEVVRLKREAAQGLATIDKLIAALAEKGNR